MCSVKKPDIECQLMVVGANSVTTGISNLGCSEEENFIQCKTAQL